MASFRVLSGLPAYGDLPSAFPESWGRFGREGTIVEFVQANGSTWVGNFKPGLGGAAGACGHPDGSCVVVFAHGDVWVVDPDTRTGEQIMVAIDGFWVLSHPDGVLMSRQGLAFLRLGPGGVVWHTKRLSWDGFSEIRLTPTRLTGLAWDALNDAWTSFTVDLSTGRSTGGAFGSHDAEGWESICPDEG